MSSNSDNSGPSVESLSCQACAMHCSCIVPFRPHGSLSGTYYSADEDISKGLRCSPVVPQLTGGGAGIQTQICLGAPCSAHVQLLPPLRVGCSEASYAFDEEPSTGWLSDLLSHTASEERTRDQNPGSLVPELTPRASRRRSHDQRSVLCGGLGQVAQPLEEPERVPVQWPVTQTGDNSR